ncbi:DUF11 domain-containing protein [Candidatus Parcubacteria bacterium]|nr:DUF11 domain-containing protein [Candidatus Parcubacteria bacterium]
MSFLGVFFVVLPIDDALADEPSQNMCVADVDVVLVMDRSGSMEDGGFCEWESVYNSACVSREKSGLTKDQCLAIKDDDEFPNSCRAPVYTATIPNKITDAKQAANNFLGKLGTNDQSALVSFADNATRDKFLTSTHTEIGDLTIGGGANIGAAIASANIELASSTNANPQAMKAIILLADGNANKPDENAVQYAKNMADQAALLGHKIFTIGLGDNIDAGAEALLEYIADVTGAKRENNAVGYYYASTGDGLENIYDNIGSQICNYGSISGCKYNDVDEDSDIIGEEKIGGWVINLSQDGNLISEQETVSDVNDENYGCYTFAGLMSGIYTVSEIEQNGWTQTYPTEESFWTVELLEEGVNANERHFGNYQIPDEPETGSITIIKNSNSSSSQEFVFSSNLGIDFELIDNGSNSTSSKSFFDIPVGSYSVTENVVSGWNLTEISCVGCINGNYNTTGNSVNITLGQGDNVECTFFNEQDIPSTSIISGYKFEDQDGATTTNEYLQNPGKDWVINLFDVTVSTTATTTTNVNGYFEFNDLEDGEYILTETLKSGWEQLMASSSDIVINGSDSENNNFVNYYAYCGNEILDNNETCDDGQNNGIVCDPSYGSSCNYCSDICQIVELSGSYCGDGIKNGNEECDGSDGVSSGYTCDSNCELQSAGGGGGFINSALSIENTQVEVNSAKPNSVTITWLTTHFSTSRVVYDTVPHSTVGNPPNYGYAYSTIEDPVKVTAHSVTISGLAPKTTYYFRSISHGSPEVYGQEITFSTVDFDNDINEETAVLGEEGAPVLVITKTVSKEKANPGETDIEFVIIVKNEGNLTAFNVKLNDILPQGISFQDFDGNIKDWDLGDINPGEEAAVKYMAGVNANAATKVYANNASASADNHASVTASASLEVEKVIVLAETGFKFNEFIILFVSLLTLASSAIFIRSRQTV